MPDQKDFLDLSFLAGAGTQRLVPRAVYTTSKTLEQLE